MALPSLRLERNFLIFFFFLWFLPELHESTDMQISSNNYTLGPARPPGVIPLDSTNRGSKTVFSIHSWVSANTEGCAHCRMPFYTGDLSVPELGICRGPGPNPPKGRLY